MAKVSRILALLAIVGALSVLPPAAWAQSDPPHTFVGKAMANGFPLKAGGTVTAWDGDRNIGTATTTVGGAFTLQVDRASGPISFRINGVAANETYPAWMAGGLTGNPTERFILNARTTMLPDCAPRRYGPGWEREFRGPAGPKGEKGDKGDRGAAGPAGAVGPAGSGVTGIIAIIIAVIAVIIAIALPLTLRR